MIRIKGAREHNLKNISLDLPRDKLIIITGLSGSGKSSLAFDTIYAEGQRRYVESLSAYARQFLGQLQKPDLDSIDGLSPAISIEQKTTHRNPRSTVGTVTEIYDYLRLLLARIGKPHCPQCQKSLVAQPVDSIIEQVLSLSQNDEAKVQVLAPLIRNKKGEFKDLFEKIAKDGFSRVRVDGVIQNLEEDIALEKNKKHTIEIIIDRLVLKKGEEESIRSRLSDSIELSLSKSDQTVIILYSGKDIGDGEKLFSTKLACLDCDISFPEVTHRMFSFNSPEGACPECSGIGSSLEFHQNLLIPDTSKKVSEGVFAEGGLGWSGDTYWYQATISALSEKYKFDVNLTWEELPQIYKDIILYGTGTDKIAYVWEKADSSSKFQKPFEGIIPNIRRRYHSTTDAQKQRLEQFMIFMPCHACKGSRLKPEALSVRIHGKNIAQITSLSIEQAEDFIKKLELTKNEAIIAQQALKEASDRLGFLNSVGVGYLTLDRIAGTLSGGEAQRIRLATQIGSALTGVIYVLDEPSIGLHQSDNEKLIKTLHNLRNLGNTVIVVEHDEETMEAADHIVDMGVGAGIHGGNVIHNGDYASLLRNSNSLTGQYLSKRKNIPIPKERRKGNGLYIEVIGAAENNLKNVDVKFPLGMFVAVTGLSGGGKSSLVNEILYKGLAQILNRNQNLPGVHKKILGHEYIDKIIEIDQSPIGRTPRSNPVTYTGAFTPIRELLAQMPASKLRGYQAGRFSFNVPGGRCESCQGDGVKKIEMHFLTDVYVECEVCNGKRYNYETLEVRYKNKNISEILDMSVEEALSFFEAIPTIKNKLQALFDVGLGYMRIGQAATTLSGGEAQRIKLATELSKRSTGKTLYILDEPTTGLHFEDINQLLTILHRFVEGGNTVIVIEHNMDVIKTADWIIDLGPSGGNKGGYIVAEGTPEEIIQSKSLTGIYLKRWLKE